MRKILTTLLYLILLNFMFSCGIVDMIEAEQPVSIKTSNVYKDLDMDVFKGFVDKKTVGELIREHGKPDTILDANEVAAVEGYGIYQYQYPDCSIDCYVPRKVDGKLIGGILEDTLIMNELVDYIYYEPNKNIKLNSFVLNDSISQLIPQGKSVVYYIGDPFHNIVRFRLAKDNKGEIINVALNDVSMLEQENSLNDAVSEFSEIGQISLGDLGEIINLSYDKRQLSFTIKANDTNKSLKKFESENPTWANIIAIRIFEEQRGIYKWLTDDVIREGADVKLILVNDKSNESLSNTINHSSFKRLFEHGFSNIERLKAFTEFENLTFPYTINGQFTHQKLIIQDNFLVFPFRFEEAPPKDFEIDIDKMKKHETQLLLDPENPERDNYSLCYYCNYGVKKEYRFIGSDETIVIVFTPDEVKELMKKL